MPQGAVFPEQRNLRLVGRSNGAVGPAEAPDVVELLGEFGACRIVEVRCPKLRAGSHRPRPDAAVTRIETSAERRERGAGRRAVEGAGRAPPQRIPPPLVAPQIEVDLARFGAIVGAHPKHLARRRAAPFDAQRLRLARGEPREEGDAFEQERLLEGLGRRARKCHAIGDFGICITRTGTDAEGLTISLHDPVRGQEPGGRRKSIVVRGPRRQHPLVADLLKRCVYPVEDRVAVLRLHDLPGIGRAVSVGSDMGTSTSSYRHGRCRERRTLEETSSRNAVGSVLSTAHQYTGRRNS